MGDRLPKGNGYSKSISKSLSVWTCSCSISIGPTPTSHPGHAPTSLSWTRLVCKDAQVTKNWKWHPPGSPLTTSKMCMQCIHLGAHHCINSDQDTSIHGACALGTWNTSMCIVSGQSPWKPCWLTGEEARRTHCTQRVSQPRWLCLRLTAEAQAWWAAFASSH